MSRVAETNVLKVIDNMKSERTLENYVKKPKTIYQASKIVALEAVTAATVSINPVLSTVCFLAGGYSLYKIFEGYKFFKNVNPAVIKKIENSKQYSHLCEIYFTYIREVAKFIKQFGLKDSRDLILMCELMMEEGYFSTTFHHEYHKFPYEKELLEPYGTIGCRVLTGKSVCRHMSSFFADLLHQLNLTTCNVVVRVRDGKKETRKFAHSLKKVFNHSVVGVVDKDGKYLYDPTCGKFCVKSESFILGHRNKLRSQVERDSEQTYFISKKHSHSLNKLHFEDFQDFKSAKFKTFSGEEIEKSRRDIRQFYIENMEMFDDFYYEHLDMIEEIARYAEMLIPKSDSEIKEWVLTK